jgi:hypothetical protein
MSAPPDEITICQDATGRQAIRCGLRSAANGATLREAQGVPSSQPPEEQTR